MEGQKQRTTFGPFGAIRTAAGYGIVALALACCSGLLAYGAGRGLDLTDEIFYLIWTRDPHAYQLIYQPFGYLLHPLFVLVGGRLQAFRLAGFAIAAAAGSVLGITVAPAKRRGLFAMQGALAGLTIFFPWIITPSYNSAANVGALLIVAGLLAVVERPSGREYLASFLIGSGLCVAAFSKPPLFACGIVGMILAGALARTSGKTFALIGALSVGVCFIFLLITPTELIGLVQQIIFTQHALALPNTPLALPGKLIREWLTVPMALSAAAVASGASWIPSQSSWSKWAGWSAIGLSLFYLGNAASDAIDGAIPDFLGLAFVIVAAGYAGVTRDDVNISLLRIAILLAAPLAVALGTFNNFWSQLNFSMAFSFVAIFILGMSDRNRWRKVAALALSVIGPPMVMLLAANYPYSLADSIFAQRFPVEPPFARGPILVDEETSDFLGFAKGLASGASVVDLSGTGPGVAAVLGARTPILPWLNPATPSWPNVVWAGMTANERQHAWFVGPTLKAFAPTAPAIWLSAHRSAYCRTDLAPMTFWGREMTLNIWRPCVKLG